MEPKDNQLDLPASKNLFTRRIGALIIDFTILATFGFVFAQFGKEFFVKLGTHGVLVGWVISSIYYTIFNCKVAGGRSPGKQAVQLKVAKIDGSELSIGEGMLRSILFTTPYFLFDYIQNLFSSPIISSIFGALNISYYVGLFYFFMVNSDRRTVHDLFARTVVQLQNSEISAVKSVSKLKVYCYIGIVVLIVGAFIGTYFSFKDKANALTGVVEANIEVLEEIALETYELDQVLRFESTKINVTVDSEIGIVIEAWVDEDVNRDEAEETYDQILDILSAKTFNINRIDYSEVVLKYGYDIGIANYQTSRSWKRENSK